MLVADTHHKYLLPYQIITNVANTYQVHCYGGKYAVNVANTHAFLTLFLYFFLSLFLSFSLSLFLSLFLSFSLSFFSFFLSFLFSCFLGGTNTLKTVPYGRREFVLQGIFTYISVNIWTLSERETSCPLLLNSSLKRFSMF